MNLAEFTSRYKFRSDDPCYIHFLTDGVLTLIDFTGGIDPLLYITTTDVKKLVGGSSASSLLSEPGFIKGFCVIGRVYQGQDHFESKLEVQALQDFVDKVNRKFIDLLEDYIGKSESFSNFLSQTIGYKDYNADINTILNLTYFWLIGERKQNKDFIGLPVFDKKYGVFIHPESHDLPIYSNALFAQMAAYEYKEKYGYDLHLFEIPCLGCFLTGLGQTAGKKISDITYLNNKWKIEYYGSDEGAYKIPNHFIIEDRGEKRSFILIGCADHGMQPVWVEKEYARNNGFLSHDLRVWINK